MCRLTVLITLWAGLSGCATDEVAPTYGDGLGTPENPIPADGVNYTVRSMILPSAATLPTAVTSVSATMRGFAQAPAHTLLALATTAAVPELAQLTSALPTTLSSKLEGYLDAEIDKARINGKTARQYATDLASFAETNLTQFELDSTLAFTPEVTKHALTTLRFRPAGFEVVVPIGGLVGDVLEQHPVVTIGAAGAITFGDHHFGLAFGRHAWQGINLASTSVYGADTTTALAAAVNCHAVAVAVAAKCVSSSCVGHQPQLEAVCMQGLALLMADVEARVVAFDFNDLRYVSGSAHLVDDDLDGLANRIEGGVWSPELNLGPARATFTASAK